MAQVDREMSGLSFQRKAFTERTTSRRPGTSGRHQAVTRACSNQQQFKLIVRFDFNARSNGGSTSPESGNRMLKTSSSH